MNQSALVGGTLPQPLAVTVSDKQGRGVPGVTVVWAVVSGNGSLSPATSVTDASGVARTQWTLGTFAGTQKVNASANGLAMAEFTATATPGSPAQLQADFKSPVTDFAVGDSVGIQALVVDQFGNAVPGQTLSFTSSNPAVASVTRTGAVVGVSPGSAIISIGTGSLSTSLSILVAASFCDGQSVLALAVGEDRQFVGGLGNKLCLSGGTTGAEFLVSTFYNDPSGSRTLFMNVAGARVTDAAGPPSPDVVPSAGPGLSTELRGDGALPVQDEGFHLRLLRRSAPELRARRAAARAARRGSAGGVGARFSAAIAVPKVGDQMQLNGDGEGGCDTPKLKAATVRAVTQGAVVVSDNENPAGGFTDADYQSIGVEFDTLVNPVDTANFGRPTDIDNNGRVVILVTLEVNRLTPKGSASYIGGFFSPRDLYPKAQCPGSNAAEMFYLIAPDPSGVANNVRTTTFVRGIITGIVGHEYQHLINASHRLYDPAVPDAAADEAIWLNEGLSHIAEELLFYRASGSLAPRQNITADRVNTQRILDAYNNYQSANIGRLRRFLLAPENHSPIAPDDSLETRGATWSLLRYLADRRGGAERDFWQALVGKSTTVGLTNLQQALGGAAPMPMLLDWTLSTYLDDAVPSPKPAYTQPSWNMRNFMLALQGVTRFPLRVYPLAGGGSTTGTAAYTLLSGSAGYVRFGVAANNVARITTSATRAGGVEAPPTQVTVTVVRTK